MLEDPPVSLFPNVPRCVDKKKMPIDVVLLFANLSMNYSTIQPSTAQGVEASPALLSNFRQASILLAQKHSEGRDVQQILDVDHKGGKSGHRLELATGAFCPAAKLIGILDVVQDFRQLSDQEIMLKRDLKVRFLGMTAIEKLRERQASRLVSIRAAEAKSKLFYLQANGRIRKNMIHSLETDDGVHYSHEKRQMCSFSILAHTLAG